MKRVILFIILFSLAVSNYSKSQDEDIKVLFQKFLKFYSSGDLVNAEDILLLILDSKMSVPEAYEVAIYNNLSAMNILMGKYEEALEYNNVAENRIKGEKHGSQNLSIIYINKASIYNIQKSYDLAIEYLEKSIRIV